MVLFCCNTSALAGSSQAAGILWISADRRVYAAVSSAWMWLASRFILHTIIVHGNLYVFTVYNLERNSPVFKIINCVKNFIYKYFEQSDCVLCFDTISATGSLLKCAHDNLNTGTCALKSQNQQSIKIKH